MMNNDKIVKELIRLSIKAEKKGEIPISAIIVKDDKIISKAYNKTIKNNDVMGHAEILVIKKAAKKLKNWRLNNCILYVTLEPCSMCKEIIKKSRINNIYYYIKQNDHKTDISPKYEYIENIELSSNLSNYFKEVRKK